MTESGKSRFQSLIDGLKSTNREEKLLSVAAVGILRVRQHADALVDLLSSPDREVVAQVVKALGRIGNPGSVKHLVAFIVNDVGNLADIAFNALKSFNFLLAIDVVIRACSADQPPAVRKQLLELLSSYDDVRVASLMNEILGQTRDAELLTTAVNYFIKHPSSERHTSLKMLAGNSNWGVSLAANIALSRLKDEGAYAHVRRLVKSSNAEVRQLIAEALVNRPLIEDRSIFLVLFEDSRGRIREIACEGLALFGTDERISILRRWLASESEQKVRLLLIKKAEAEKSALLYDELYKLLQTQDEQIKAASIEAIAAMGEKISDRILIDFDRMPLVVKEQLLLVLGQIGSNKALRTIKESLTAKERWLCINAVDAAARMHSEELNSELVKMLKATGTDIWVRATVVAALGTSFNTDFAEVVAEQVLHDDARVRANAVEALSELNWPGLPDVCHRLLHDRNDRVRVNSAIALWRGGHQEVFGELEKMARDKSRWVRSSAVFALGRIKDHAGTPILLKLLADPEDMVYRNAVEALSEQGDLRAMLPLLKESRGGRLPADFYEKALTRFTETMRS